MATNGGADLYLYNGTVATGQLLVNNAPTVNYDAQCSAGQCFQLCEQNGIILTDTVQSSLTFTSLQPCPAGTVQLSAEIASCDGACVGAT